MATFKVTAVFLFLILLFGCVTDLSGQEQKFITKYKCLDLSGKLRWAAQVQISHTSGKPEEVLLLVERGQGYFSGFKNRVSWVGSLEFIYTKETVAPLFMERRISDEKNNLLAIETQKFDLQNKKVFYTYEVFSEKRKKIEQFRFKGDIVNRMLLALYIQKTLENGQLNNNKPVTIFSSEPAIYRVNIRADGKEKIDINGHKVLAYKLRLDPQMGLLNLIKVMLPRVYIWHSVTPKFEWLQYMGLENDITSPRVKIITMDN